MYESKEIFFSSFHYFLSVEYVFTNIIEREITVHTMGQPLEHPRLLL